MTEHPDEFTINVAVSDGIGVLSWNGATNFATLREAIEMATDDVIMDKGVRRVEVQVPAGDPIAVPALQMAGFRREGIRREAYAVGDGYGDVWLYARLAGDIAYGDGSFSAVLDSVLPKKRALAHVLYRDAEGRVLMLQTSYKSDWELPGGVVEPDESPRQGAQREVSEELGLDLPVSGLLCADWLPRHLGWSDAMQYVFDGGVLTPEQQQFAFDDGEIVAAHWLTLDEIAGHTYDGAARRLRAILTHPGAAPLYLEGGNPVDAS